MQNTDDECVVIGELFGEFRRSGRVSDRDHGERAHGGAGPPDNHLKSQGAQAVAPLGVQLADLQNNFAERLQPLRAGDAGSSGLCGLPSIVRRLAAGMALPRPLQQKFNPPRITFETTAANVRDQAARRDCDAVARAGAVIGRFRWVCPTRQVRADHALEAAWKALGPKPNTGGRLEQVDDAVAIAEISWLPRCTPRSGRRAFASRRPPQVPASLNLRPRNGQFSPE